MLGYYGNRCQFRDLCDYDNPCLNGQCITSGHNLFQCDCDQGWSGIVCDYYDPCVFTPCGKYVEIHNNDGVNRFSTNFGSHNY